MSTPFATARLQARRARHGHLAATLSALDGGALAAVLDTAPAWRNHIHGDQSGVVEVEGAKIFVKKIALTDLERRPEHVRSTANLFDLPTFYQYGVGSAGFGAWRELEAYLRASDWALSGACPYFPLLHHWRVASRSSRPTLTPEQMAWLDDAPAYWGGSDAVRTRLDAIAAASATVVLFLEHIPESLDAWLTEGLAERPQDPELEADTLRLHDQVQEAASFMNAHGMLHFDLHAHNILTDGVEAYVADFGLALCDDFELSPAERVFFEAHRLYDRSYVAWDLVDRIAKKAPAPPAPATALGRLLHRYDGVTSSFRRFFDGLTKDRKTAPYPSEELAKAFAALG